MKVEDCIVAVERRSMGGCLDLAFVFAREFAGPLLKLWLIFALPSVGLVWLLTSRSTDMLMPSLLIFMFFASLFSGALVAAIGPQVFGVPISTKAALRSLQRRLVGYLFLSGIYRLLQFGTSFCMFFPGVMVTSHFGHLAEVMLLEQTPVMQTMQRLSWLGKGGGYSRNLGRLLGLLVFWGVFSAGLFILIDILAGALFNFTIMFGRIPRPDEDFTDKISSLFIDNPVVLTTLQIAIWLPYPIVRLAWFFCYLDQRIRNECWDLELQCRTETVRLEESLS